jgi:hypothetical protein
MKSMKSALCLTVLYGRSGCAGVVEVPAVGADCTGAGADATDAALSIHQFTEKNRYQFTEKDDPQHRSSKAHTFCAAKATAFCPVESAAADLCPSSAASMRAVVPLRSAAATKYVSDIKKSYVASHFMSCDIKKFIHM